MRDGEAARRALLLAALIVAAAVLSAGCGARHTVGDTVVHDPEAEAGQAADPAGEDPPAPERASEEGPPEPTKAEPQAGQFLEAKGTSVGGEDWVAEIRREGNRFWLVSPFDEATTYAMVRAATYLQGLRLAEEDFDRQRFTTTLAYKAWHSDDEGGWALTMKVLTKGFGKDARYRFRVSVARLEGGGSRVGVRQFRQVMEEQPRQDVGDWVEADEPDPEITRKYLEGLQRAMGN